MKVNIIKEHEAYPKGIADVSEDRGNYLIRVGIAKPLGKGVVGEIGPELVNLPPGADAFVSTMPMISVPDEAPEKVEAKEQKEKVEVKKAIEKVTRKK